MVRFNSAVALVVLAISLFFFGQGSLPFYIALAIVSGLVYPVLFANKIVIAFDAGGVITEGDYWTDEVKERKGMRQLVKKLKGKYRVILLTNQNALSQKAFDKKFGYSGLFDAQVVSGEVGVKKPDTKIFSYVVKKFGVKPGEVVFVDDSAENVNAAKGIGIKAIQFTSLDALVPELRKLNITI